MHFLEKYYFLEFHVNFSKTEACNISLYSGEVLVISYFTFLVSMVNRFLLKYKKCPKMGSICQTFASLRAKITIFSDIKRSIMLK